jgi:hypothetical protein
MYKQTNDHCIKIMSNIPTNFYTIFWYGEKFYAASDVDTELRRASRDLDNVVSQLVEARSNAQTIQNMYNASTDYWTAVANAGTSALHGYNETEPEPEPESNTAAAPPAQADTSPRSTCSSSNGGRGGGAAWSARGRTIGKRNQEFYIPNGVLLSHTAHTDLEGECDEWFGRYDKESNKIIRTVTCTNDANADDNDLDEYETLKHFAQEHDREMCQERHKGVQEYRECNTPNVWTNPLFKFYNTVSLKWEPLSALRTDN